MDASTCSRVPRSWLVGTLRRAPRTPPRDRNRSSHVSRRHAFGRVPRVRARDLAFDPSDGLVRARGDAIARGTGSAFVAGARAASGGKASELAMIKEVRAPPTFSAPIARHRLAFAPSPAPHPASVVPRAHATVAHSPSSSSSPVPPTPLRQLREKTGAPLMDVKKALAATEFDMEAAHAELRKRGLAAAGKKAGRVAADGLVGVKVSDCGRYAASSRSTPRRTSSPATNTSSLSSRTPPPRW